MIEAPRIAPLVALPLRKGGGGGGRGCWNRHRIDFHAELLTQEPLTRRARRICAVHRAARRRSSPLVAARRWRDPRSTRLLHPDLHHHHYNLSALSAGSALFLCPLALLRHAKLFELRQPTLA